MVIKGIGQNPSVQDTTPEEVKDSGQAGALNFRPGQGEAPRVGSSYGMLERIDMARSRVFVGAGQSAQREGEKPKLSERSLEEATRLLHALDDSRLDSPGVTQALGSFAKAIVDELQPRMRDKLTTDHCAEAAAQALMQAVEGLEDPAQRQRLEAFLANIDKTPALFTELDEKFQDLSVRPPPQREYSLSQATLLLHALDGSSLDSEPVSKALDAYAAAIIAELKTTCDIGEGQQPGIDDCLMVAGLASKRALDNLADPAERQRLQAFFGNEATRAAFEQAITAKFGAQLSS